MASSDEVSHDCSENRGFCADKVRRLVSSPHIFNRTHRIVPWTGRWARPLILVLDVPIIVLIRVVVRISAPHLVLFSLVAVFVCLTEVVLRVAFHPFHRDAFASLRVLAIDCRAKCIALSEGLSCHSGCQNGESFHNQICNYNKNSINCSKGYQKK